MKNLLRPPVDQLLGSTWILSISIGRCVAASMVAFTATVFGTSAADARVTRLEVEDRVTISGGAYDGVGQYERLRGTAYFEVDPKNKRNAIITDLENAPRNKDGNVEFSSQFYILKPLKMKKGNHKIWYGINNRGFCIEYASRRQLQSFNCNPATIEDLGADNPLFTEGFTVVDAGWHGDGFQTPDRSRLFPSFPIAKKRDGSPITGPHRVELTVSAPSFSQSLVPGYKPYPTASTSTKNARLTMRRTSDAVKKELSPDEWAFGACPTGKESLVASDTDICIFDGFKAGRIYELEYTAKDPIVMGLGYAVTRDLAAFLKSEKKDGSGNKNPLMEDGVKIRRAYVSGTSSTGMYLREFLYLGFNEDEKGNRVFDAANIYSAATHRLFANVRFASPTYFSGQDQHHIYTSNSVPPFTYAVTKDPVSGVTDGLLKRPKTDPLVLQTDEELIFFQWKASLNVVDSSGKALPIPSNVRLYFQNGFGHVSASGLLSPPASSAACRNLEQVGTPSITITARALVKVLDDWADKGVAPPDSNYPTLQNNSLISFNGYRNRFPKVPGLFPPENYNELRALDFGPKFSAEGGVQTTLPPREGAKYNILVPKPSPDGDGRAGIDTMFTRSPLGTNVGWNNYMPPRDDDLCFLSGSYFPFARTKAQRDASGDSRLSLEERYGDHRGFVRHVRRSARALVEERFLTQIDADRFIAAAKESDVLK